MRITLLIMLFMIATSCNQTNSNKALQARLDSLESKYTETYKPGFGEFMTSIQLHHAKLWFAGINNNWKLADFEIHEIQETLDDIQKFNTDRPETKSIVMIYPALDSVNHAIAQHNSQQFKSSFMYLTNTCNICHRATEHEFNVVIIPSNPPTSNQSFEPLH